LLGSWCSGAKPLIDDLCNLDGGINTEDVPGVERVVGVDIIGCVVRINVVRCVGVVVVGDVGVIDRCIGDVVRRVTRVGVDSACIDRAVIVDGASVGNTVVVAVDGDVAGWSQRCVVDADGCAGNLS